MSFVGDLFSGSKGTGWEPQRAASLEQAQQLYGQTQEQLQKQREFTQALMGQVPGALGAQRDLASLYQQQMAGTAPSVAKAQLDEATRQNAARTAAMMASQRGAGANVGLMARQAGMAGSQAQQQAAGQAALLRAEEQQKAQAGMQGLSAQQIASAQQAQGTGTQAALSAQQLILNQIAQQEAAKAGIAQQTAKGQSDIVGGLISGIASGAMGGAAHGGMAGKDFSQNYAQGGGLGSDDYWDSLKKNLGSIRVAPTLEGDSDLKKSMQKLGKAGTQSLLKQEPNQSSGSTLNQVRMPGQVVPPMYAEGGKIPAMVSPGEKYLSPSEVEKVKDGKKEAIDAGKKIPGKAKVEGDSLKNDTVKMTLEEGGIVIPRSVVQSKDPGEQARKFVQAVLAKQASKRK
jgi:hypothetical protein